jgi:hypothetical protein
MTDMMAFLDTCHGSKQGVFRIQSPARIGVPHRATVRSRTFSA